METELSELLTDGQINETMKFISREFVPSNSIPLPPAVPPNHGDRTLFNFFQLSIYKLFIVGRMFADKIEMQKDFYNEYTEWYKKLASLPNLANTVKLGALPKEDALVQIRNAAAEEAKVEASFQRAITYPPSASQGELISFWNASFPGLRLKISEYTYTKMKQQFSDKTIYRHGYFANRDCIDIQE